jgi:hypothetical protein
VTENLLAFGQTPADFDYVADDTLAKAPNFGGMLSKGGRGSTPRGEGSGRRANLTGKYWKAITHVL